MKRLAPILFIPLLLSIGIARIPAQSCPAGFTPRFVVSNSCGDDVWMIETPPGNTSTVQGQWTWFSNISTTTTTLYNGGVVGGLLVKAGSKQTICVPDKGAPGGNFRFYMGCPNNNQNPFDLSGCTVGAFAGDRAAINTLFEPSFGCKPGLSGQQCAFNPAAPGKCQSDQNSTNCPAMPPADNFDISAVDGFTIPIKVDAQPLSGQTCSRPSTDAGMLDLASCPVENQATIYSDSSAQQGLINAGIKLLTADNSGQNLQACTAPYKWMQTASLGSPANPAPSSGECNVDDNTFNSSCFYSGGGCDPSDRSKRCPSHSGPQQKVGPTGDGKLAIQNTNWVQDLYALGYHGYSWQYGDGVGDQSCGWGETITLTLCPKGGVPSRAGQAWRFDETSGSCTTSGSLETVDGVSTFGSLVDCQHANMRYTCDDLTPNDPNKVTSALWKADTNATLAQAGFTYDAVQSKRRLVCKTSDFNLGDGNFSLPECNYVYTDDDTRACPSAGVGAPSPLPVTFAGQGRATGVGSGRNTGELRIEGTFTVKKAINMNVVSVNLSELLNDGSGPGELVTNRKNKTFAPLLLKPVVNWDGRRTIFEGNPAGPAHVQLIITRVGGHKPQYDFELAIERAAIAQPVACAMAKNSLSLSTKFSLQKDNEAITAVRGTMTYACEADVLTSSALNKNIQAMRH